MACKLLPLLKEWVFQFVASKYTIQALPPIFVSVGLSIGYEIFSARQPMVRSIPGHSQPDVSVSYSLPEFFIHSAKKERITITFTPFIIFICYYY